MKLGKNQNMLVEFDEKRAINRHICILGKSGTGKSTASHKLMLEMAKEGETVLALDIHRVLATENIYGPLRTEFEKNANVIDLAEGPMTLPIFSNLAYGDGKRESDINLIGAIVDVVKRTFNLGEVQQSELRKACEYCKENNLYATLGMKGIEQALEIIGGKAASRLLDKLYMLFAQPIFVDGEDPIVAGKINIIRLGHLDLDTQAVIAEIILSFIWRRAIGNALNGKMVIYLDEFQNLSFRARSPLSQMLTEGRRFGLQLLLCSQSLGICFTDSQQKRILQSGLMIYFKPTDNERRSIAAMISSNRVSDYTLLLSSLSVGEAIVTGDLLLNGRIQKVPLKVSFRDDTTR